MSAQPVGYSQMPESLRCSRRISPSSLPTTAPTATLGVTYPGTPSSTMPSHSWTVDTTVPPGWARPPAARISAATCRTSS